MRLSEGSLLCSYGRRSLSWLDAVLRDSQVVTAAAWVSRAVGRTFHGSRTFGTSRLQSTPLEAAGQPLAVRAVARPYMWLRGALAEGAPGRAVHKAGARARQSDFGGGTWTRLLGAALLGMALGRAADSAVLPAAILGAVGLVLAIWGPELVVAVGDSLVFRRFWVGSKSDHSERHDVAGRERSKPVIVTGMVVCAVSGVAAGAVGTSGSLWLLGITAFIAIAAVLLWRPEAILLGAAAFPWLDALARKSIGGLGAAWDEAFLVLSAFLILWGALVTGRLKLRTVPALLPIACVFTAAVGSIVVRGVPADVGLFALRLMIEPMLFYVVGFLLYTTVPWLRRVVIVFLGSTTALALHGLFQYFAKVETPEAWLDAQETEIVTRAYSIMGKPNELGSILVIGILVAVALLLSPGVRKRSRVIYGGVVITQAMALAVTFSRGAWLGLAAGLLALVFLAYRRYLLLVFLLGAAGLLAAPRVFVERFKLIFSQDYLEKSAVDGRLYRWDTAVDHLTAHPWFGIGLGRFGGSAAQTYGYFALWTDNYYLQLGAEGGILLLASFLWLLLRVGKGLVKGFFATGDPYVRAVSAGMFGALIAIVVTNLFLGAMESRPVAVALWLMTGLVTSAALNGAAKTEA